MILNKHKVLLIGCGNMGGGFDLNNQNSSAPLTHAAGYMQNENFQLIACLDPHESRRTTVAKKWGIPYQFSSINELLNNPQSYDIVSICSPTDEHATHIQTAIQLKPKLIFCEKPITPSFEETKRMVELCRTHDVGLMVNYSRYWDPSIEKLQMQIDHHEWGELRSVVAHYNKGLLNNGSHMMGILLKIFGSIKVITADNIFFDSSLSDPTVAAFLKTKNGVPIYLNPTHANDFSLFELELYFSKGVVKMLEGGLSWQVQKPIEHQHYSGYKKLDSPNNYQGNYLMAMSLAIKNIYEYLTNGQRLLCSGSDALAIQNICETIHLAANKDILNNHLSGI